MQENIIQGDCGLTEELNKKVIEARKNVEIRRAYMTLQEKMDDAREEGFIKGKTEGITKGRADTLRQYIAECRKQGISEEEIVRNLSVYFNAQDTEIEMLMQDETVR
jgi:hypothetical protein